MGMGKRRKAAAKPAAKKPKLDTEFDCPYCGNNKCVEVKMNRPDQLGELKCRVCGVSYQTRVNYLNEPVDVYAEWIDAAAENQAEIDRAKALAEAQGPAAPDGGPDEFRREVGDEAGAGSPKMGLEEADDFLDDDQF